MSRRAPAVVVRCGECDVRFELSARNEYGHRARGTTPRCSSCRVGRRLAESKVTPQLRGWWVRRLGHDGALELSRTIWPPA